MNDLALFGIITIFLLICTAFGFIRGLAKSRIRCITVALSAVLALIITLVMKSSISDAAISRFTWDALGLSSDIKEALAGSAVFTETMVGLASALVLPLVFVALFIIICFITWIIHIVVTLVLRRRLREINERANCRMLQTFLLNFVQGIVVVFVILVPVNVYSQVVTTVMDTAEEAKLLGDMPDVYAMVDDYVDPVTDSMVLRAFRVTGGEMIGNALTDFEVGGATARLNDELEVVSKVVCRAVSFAEASSESSEDETAALIDVLADSFDRSVILPAVAGDLLYDATDAWNRGNHYLGIERPSAGELFDPLIVDIIEVLHNDAKSRSALRADLYTISDIFVILDEHNVLSKFSDDSALTDLVGSNGVVKALTAKLEENESMKVLVPTINQIGMRAIATSLNLDGEGQEEYQQLLGDIAGSLNSTANMSEEARVAAISDQFAAAFADAGVAIDREVLDSYSVSFVEEFGTSDTVTSDDVSEFLLTYALEGNAVQ